VVETGESPTEVDKVFDKLEGHVVHGGEDPATAKQIAKVIQDTIWVAVDVLNELYPRESED
jgi:hypothetical protein